MKSLKIIKATRLSTMLILFSLLTPLAALAGKIPDGIYWQGPVDGFLEVRGNKYREADEQGTYPWKSTSELVLIKKGVIEQRSYGGRAYHCSSSSHPQKGSASYVCTRNGWKKGSI
jgi:hypothetical protein